MKAKNERIFTFNFVLIFMAAGLIRVCYQMQNTIMPLYGGKIGLSATQIGLTTTFCTIASLILRPFLGIALDRWGRKGFVIAGTFLFAIATFCCGFTGSFAVLLSLRSLQGLGFSAHTTAVNTMASDELPESRMTEGIGLMGLTGSVSTAIAPAIALFLISGGNYRAGFIFAAGVGFLAVVSLIFTKSCYSKPEKSNQSKEPFIKGIFEPGAVKPAIIMMILGACNAGVATFLATYALGRGFSSGNVSLYFTVSAVAMAAARLFGGKAAQKIGTNRAVIIATVLNVTAFILIPISTTPVLLWVSAALYGLGYGTIYPMMNAQAVIRSRKDRRGAAMSTFLTGTDIGIGFGAGMWGVVIDNIGISSMFWISAAISIATCAAYLLLMGRKEKGDEQYETRS